MCKNTFKDPSTSPAYYAKTLLVKFTRQVTTVEVEEGSWIPTFSHLLHLNLNLLGLSTKEFGVNSLYGFSPTLKYLRVSFDDLPFSQISDLIDSFPLLVHLSVSNGVRCSFTCDRAFDWKSITAEHTDLPPFTGSLDLCLGGEMGLIARRLLSLPSGLHFRKMHLAWTHARDIPSIMALVEGCSSTVESLTVASGYPGGYPCRPVWHLHLHGWLTTAVDEPLPGLIDLSKATKLRDATFEFRRPQWVSDTLRTIAPSNGNLQQISLSAPYVIFTLSFRSVDPATLPRVLGETTCREWLELDRLLVLLWETHSIRLKILYLGSFRVDRPSARKCMDSLFPEVTTRGIADLEECEFGS